MRRTLSTSLTLQLIRPGLESGSLVLERLDRYLKLGARAGGSRQPLVQRPCPLCARRGLLAGLRELGLKLLELFPGRVELAPFLEPPRGSLGPFPLQLLPGLVLIELSLLEHGSERIGFRTVSALILACRVELGLQSDSRASRRLQSLLQLGSECRRLRGS